MESKIHFRFPKVMKKGLTMIELIAATAVILVLIAALVIKVNPIENQKTARDIKRLSDLATLERAINEYRMDSQNYPDTSGVLRISTLLPAGNTQLENTSSGWIDQDLSKYLSKIPSDPVNDATYYYSYIQNGSGYEINAKLEFMVEQMQNDGGDDPNMYETGNILNLISP